jgi:hypothetical protein
VEKGARALPVRHPRSCGGELRGTLNSIQLDSRQRLKAAAVIRNGQPTLNSPRNLVLRIPPVCFIYPNTLSISGLLRWLIV